MLGTAGFLVNDLSVTIFAADWSIYSSCAVHVGFTQSKPQCLLAKKKHDTECTIKGLLHLLSKKLLVFILLKDFFFDKKKTYNITRLIL